ncbi:hypothetical protein [uncultured Chitinophaga sp.]|uniref:hypothetical protein n=1 Tax=uncultured Chitinophaga sp. TaxID=339340 RepID=UPI0025CE7367|nr:hypothetical protein [uncultured Chitinophaga sp.]
MKRILLIALLTSHFAPYANAQDVNLGNANAGLGTSSPSSYYHGGNNKVLEIWNPNTVTNSQSHLILSTGSNLTGSAGSVSWMAGNAPGKKGIAFISAQITSNISTHPSGSLAFATANNDLPLVRMQLDENGNLGIGQLTPLARLHVLGGKGVLVENAPLDARTVSGSPDPNIDNPLQSLMGYNGLMSNDGGFYHWRAFWGQSVDLRAGGIPDGQRNIFRVRRFDGGTSWAELFRIAEDGNVGIGATNTSGYKLTVNGTIGTRKIKVTNQETWADFVFNEDYHLRSLPELEAFIKAHHHLPEIPTDAEVKADGVDLGDMNVKLLQKVEELTLYLIQQQKKIDDVIMENAILKKDVEKLKADKLIQTESN